MTRTHPFLGLGAWLIASFIAGAIGALASLQASAFYQQLAQPSWAPPSSVFGPVWTVLYVLMGIAAWRVWRRHGWRRGGTALRLFLAQLAVNALWSWLFFGWHLGGYAFADIVLLWLLLLGTAGLFWRLDRWAGALLLPYLAWVTFAACLNGSVWLANPAVL